jgi:hypothetical protein
MAWSIVLLENPILASDEKTKGYQVSFEHRLIHGRVHAGSGSRVVIEKLRP